MERYKPTDQQKTTTINRVTYVEDFTNWILSDFYSPIVNDPMDCADKFRHDEWKLDGDAPYAQNTRSDLYKRGLTDPQLMVWIAEVITCMRYNRSMEDECGGAE